MRYLLIFFLVSACATSSHSPSPSPSSPPLPSPEVLPLAQARPVKGNSEARGEKFMISTDGEATSRAGLFAYEHGGNAIDAAVAASFTISVERPALIFQRTERSPRVPPA